MRERSVQHVPGKVILIGEHAVLHGHPAIATPVPLQLTLTVTLGSSRHGGYQGDARVRDAFAAAAALFGLDPRCIKIRARSQLPIGGGLGSSAALSVALVRALADLCAADIGHTELLRMATEIEHTFHGRSSGLDVHATGSAGFIWFEPGPNPRVSPLDVPEPVELVVGLSGQRRSTAAQVNAFTGPHGAGAAPIRRLGELTHQVRAALARGDIAALGRVMDLAHMQLSAMGASTPTLDRMVALAREAGAAGAKLTGAGHGGAMIALAPHCGCSRQILAALKASGFDAFTTHVADATAAAVSGTSVQVGSQVEHAGA